MIKPAVRTRGHGIVIHRLVDGRFLHQAERRRHKRRAHRTFHGHKRISMTGVHTVPFVENIFHTCETVLLQLGVHIVGVQHDLPGIIGVKMPGIEIKRQIIGFDKFQKLIVPRQERAVKFIRFLVFPVDRIETAARITTHFDMRKLFFQTACRHSIKVKIFLHGPGPHGRIFRFVPDFPVGDAQFHAVRPAFIVVPNDPCTDRCPLVVVRRRRDPVGFDLVVIFNGHAQPVKGFDPGIRQRFQVGIGECKVIRCRVFRICVKIGKNVRDIHIMSPAPHTGGIVQTAVGDPGVCQFRQGAVQSDRAVVDPVQRFDFFLSIGKVHFDPDIIFHKITYVLVSFIFAIWYCNASNGFFKQ